MITETETETVIVQDRPQTEAVILEDRPQTATRVLWFIVGIINTLLLLRLVFLLLSANRVGFTEFLYTLTNPLVAPFRGIFPAPVSGGAYFDTAALVAIAIYALIAWGISTLLDVSRKSA